jgi:hypothetical protein
VAPVDSLQEEWEEPVVWLLALLVLLVELVAASVEALEVLVVSRWVWREAPELLVLLKMTP